jgi:hypothetical protein
MPLVASAAGPNEPVKRVAAAFVLALVFLAASFVGGLVQRIAADALVPALRAHGVAIAAVASVAIAACGWWWRRARRKPRHS